MISAAVILQARVDTDNMVLYLHHNFIVSWRAICQETRLYSVDISVQVKHVDKISGKCTSSFFSCSVCLTSRISYCSSSGNMPKRASQSSCEPYYGKWPVLLRYRSQETCGLAGHVGAVLMMAAVASGSNRGGWTSCWQQMLQAEGWTSPLWTWFLITTFHLSHATMCTASGVPHVPAALAGLSQSSLR